MAPEVQSLAHYLVSPPCGAQLAKVASRLPCAAAIVRLLATVHMLQRPQRLQPNPCSDSPSSAPLPPCRRAV